MGGGRAPRAVLTGGCESDLTSEHARQIESTGAVEGSVYLDVDGNGTRGGPDEPYPDLGIQLVGANGGVVAEAKTDEAGEFRMGLVPVGNYKLEVDPSTLSGGLAVFGLEEVSSVALGTQGTDNNLVTVYSVEFRVSFPVYSLSEVKDLPPGRPVTTQGFALNSRPNFGDGVVHFQEGDVYLRAINVARANISPGDSVRIVGKTSIDQGLPILEDVSVVRLVSQAVLLDPVELSTADAASADGGLLDAALIRIQNATITDTEPAPGGGLIVT
ncbi:MAG: carboxypeptidase-like regulatory domain-containing protein, partial [Gemmatimonadota bacterium]